MINCILGIFKAPCLATRSTSLGPASILFSTYQFFGQCKFLLLTLPPFVAHELPLDGLLDSERWVKQVRKGIIELFQPTKGQTTILRQIKFTQGARGPSSVLVGMKHGEKRQKVRVINTPLTLGIVH